MVGAAETPTRTRHLSRPDVFRELPPRTGGFLRKSWTLGAMTVCTKLLTCGAGNTAVAIGRNPSPVQAGGGSLLSQNRLRGLAADFRAAHDGPPASIPQTTARGSRATDERGTNRPERTSSAGRRM